MVKIPAEEIVEVVENADGGDQNADGGDQNADGGDQSSDDDHNSNDDDEEYQRQRILYSTRMRRLYRRIDVSMRHIESLKQNIRRAELLRTEGSGSNPPADGEIITEDKIREMRQELETSEQKLKRLIRTFRRLENTAK